MVRSLLLLLIASVQSAMTVTVEGQLSSKFAHMDVEAYSSVEVQLDGGYKVRNGESIVFNVCLGLRAKQWRLRCPQCETRKLYSQSYFS